jgi:hypothetical protein
MLGLSPRRDRWSVHSKTTYMFWNWVSSSKRGRVWSFWVSAIFIALQFSTSVPALTFTANCLWIWESESSYDRWSVGLVMTRCLVLLDSYCFVSRASYDERSGLSVEFGRGLGSSCIALILRSVSEIKPWLDEHRSGMLTNRERPYSNKRRWKMFQQQWYGDA